MARGGRRAGVQGRNYAQRSDLTMNARPLPVMTATGQGYGVAGAQAAAQQAVPLRAAPAPMQLPGAPAPAPAANPVAPGSMGSFDRPTERPNEPITHGAATGPGAGPEAMAMPSQNNTMAAMLAGLAASSGNRDLLLLAQRAQTLAGS